MKNSVGIIPVFVSHMGCPNDCVFCNQRKINGVVHAISPDELEAYVISYLETMKREQVELAFFGGSFTGIEIELQEKYLKVAYDFKMRGLIDKIRLSTRPDYVDDIVVQRLKKFEVDLVELGCQSFDDEVLLTSKRGHTSGIIESAVRRLKDSGVEVGIQLMLGLPGDNFRKFQDSIWQTVKLAPSCVRLYPVLVIKDTELEILYHTGVYKPLVLEVATAWCAWAYEILNEHKIQVIRMGLQRTDLIDFDGAVIAGPFHPAFGELVLSKVFLKPIEKWFKESNMKIDELSQICILTNPSQQSIVIGQNRSNIKFLLAMLSINPNQLTCKADRNVALNTVWIKNNDDVAQITIMN